MPAHIQQARFIRKKERKKDYIHLRRFTHCICTLNDANNGVMQNKTQEKGRRQTKIVYPTALSYGPFGSVFLDKN